MEAHAGLERRQRSRNDATEIAQIHRCAHGLVEHQTLGVQTAPSRPPRHLDVLIGTQEPLASVAELLQLEEDHRLRRHIEAHREGLRRKQSPHKAAAEQDLHDLLEQRLETRVVKGDAANQEAADGMILGGLLQGAAES